MKCRDVQRLVSLYVKNDPALARNERRAIEEHLLACSRCRYLYDEERELLALLQANWGGISDDTCRLLAKNGYANHAPPQIRSRPGKPTTIQKNWENLKRRCPGLAKARRQEENKHRRGSICRRIGKAAAAASILLAIGFIWTPLWNKISSRPGSADTAVTQGRRDDFTSTFVELVPSGVTAAPGLSESITALRASLQLLIGNLHRVNVEPSVTLKPYATTLVGTNQAEVATVTRSLRAEQRCAPARPQAQSAAPEL